MAYNSRVRKPKITLKLRAAVILTPSEKFQKYEKIQTANRRDRDREPQREIAQQK